VPTASQIVDGLRKGGDASSSLWCAPRPGPSCSSLVKAILAPGDLFALRLQRLEKLSGQERKRLEEQRESSLFHLPPERFPDLGEASAAMVTAPIRLHETALDTRKSLGRLERNEMRALVERFVSYWQFDLRQLLIAQIREHSTDEAPADSEIKPGSAILGTLGLRCPTRGISAHIPCIFIRNVHSLADRESLQMTHRGI
jgi:hypothetical protein